MEIQFLGVAGITQSCVNAVLRYLQFGDSISKVLIITNNHSHALVLNTEDDEIMAIKSGFSSGYPGEGPKGLAYILSILDEHNIEIEEYEVKKKVIDKINGSYLTMPELKRIENSKPVRPTRWRDYVYEYRDPYSKKENLFIEFPHVIPYSIIDPKIFDLSISFWEAPGDKILAGYRRLDRKSVV